MVKTERAGSASADSGRSDGTSAGSRRDRMSRYATVAKMAAVIPAAAFVSAADGTTVYSRTGLNEVVSSSNDLGVTGRLDITGADGDKVAELELRRWAMVQGSGANLFINQVGGGKAQFQNMWIFNRQIFRTDGTINWWNIVGVPVVAGKTWSNTGRVAGDFRGRQAPPYGVSVYMGYNYDYCDILFGWSAANTGIGPKVDDPLGIGNGGQEWFALFQFDGGALDGNYGWISYTANVVEAGDSFITITGWGWGADGNPIAAGFTGTAVPGSAGIAALAFGAAGLRGRRRSRN